MPMGGSVETAADGPRAIRTSKTKAPVVELAGACRLPRAVGSGKTTLLNLIGALDLPSEGTIKKIDVVLDLLDFEHGLWRPTAVQGRHIASTLRVAE